MSNKHEIMSLLLWGALAGFGGLARFLVSRMDESAPVLSRAKFTFLMSANILVSAFSGIMGALVASGISDSPTFVAACAGVFGYLGAEGLKMLGDKLTSKL